MVEEHTVGGRDTADEQLARQVVADLAAAGLITPEQGKKLLPRILGGRATAGDWRTLFELARPASTEGGTS